MCLYKQNHACFLQKSNGFVKRIFSVYFLAKIRTLRFLHGRILDMSNRTVSIFGFKIFFLNFDDFYWTFNDVFVDESYKLYSDRSSPKIIDCGGNIGMSVLYFKWLYPDAEIIVFEPHPNTFSLLKRNVEQNCLGKSVVLRKEAVGGKISTLELFGENRAATLNHNLFDYENSQESGNVGHGVHEVEVMALSGFITRNIDYIKLDIEGAETDVISELYNSGKMDFVDRFGIEFHKIPEKPERLSEMVSQLDKSGFSVYSDYDLEAQELDLPNHIMVYAKK